MAAVRSDRIGAPVGIRERRMLAWLRSYGSDALAGRVVWCAAALSGGHAAGRGLRELLDDELEVVPLFRGGGRAPGAVGTAARCDAGRGLPAPVARRRGADRIRPRRRARRGRHRWKGAPWDVVILHDCFTFSFAEALRDRGAHAIWHLRKRSDRLRPASGQRSTSSTDAAAPRSTRLCSTSAWESTARRELPPPSPPPSFSTFARCRWRAMRRAPSGWRSPGSACSATSSRGTGPIASAVRSRRGQWSPRAEGMGAEQPRPPRRPTATAPSRGSARGRSRR